MKRLLILLLVGGSAMTLVTGCLHLELEGGTTRPSQSPTIGQQLIDLQKAKDAGAITEVEYEAEKARLLGTQSGM